MRAGHGEPSLVSHPNYVPGLRSELERQSTVPPPPDTDPAPALEPCVRFAIGTALATLPVAEAVRLLDWLYVLLLEADRATVLAWLEGKRNA